MNTAQFFNYLKSSYEASIVNKPIVKKLVKIGDKTMALNFSGDTLLPIFFKAFDHLETVSSSINELQIYFWDSESTNTATIDSVPWKNEERNHLGLIDSFTDGRYFTLQQPGSEAIYMLDSEKNIGYYWVSTISNIPYWESDFPLRMFLHWWLIGTSYQPVHAGAVGTEKGGLLLVGKGGSGKSTSTLSCLNTNLKIAGDDYVLLDTQSKAVFSLFSLSKLNLNSIELLKNEQINIDELAPPIDGKYRIKLHPKFESSMIHCIPLVAVLLPQVTTQKNTTIVPCSSAQSLLALAPTTLFQLPGLREESFKKMSDFVRTIPSFHLLLGTEKVHLPDILEKFIADCILDSKNK